VYNVLKNKQSNAACAMAQKARWKKFQEGWNGEQQAKNLGCIGFFDCCGE